MSEKILIVGAGVCGMTLGYKLAESGYNVLIIEKQAETGGLARTYRYGDFIFDSGPHRFFSTNPEVNRFLNEVLAEGLQTAPMRSAVYFLGKYYDWPLGPRALFQLPLKTSFSIFRDFLGGLLRKEDHAPRNFEEYILQKYGQTLYQLDFGPYTEKFTKLPNVLLHPDWARAGINRAVINEDIRMNTLGEVIRTSLRPKPAVSIFYPRRGISDFHARLEERIRSRGGKIWTKREVKSLRLEDGKIKEVRMAPDGASERVDRVVWTGPIHEITGLLNLKKSDLSYLNIVVFNVSLKGEPRSDYQWIYYVDRAVPFNRLYNTVKFSEDSAPWGYYGLCVEVTCHEGDEVWKNPASFYPAVGEALKEVRLIDSPEEVVAIRHERLDKAYPIYKTNYRQELKENLDRLSPIENLILAGRTGLFWYNNMDHSIENAFRVAEGIARGKRASEIIEFWNS
jgi:protoporphyrinogen oxidase